MLSDIIQDIELDNWEQGLVAYTYLNSAEDLKSVCNLELQEKMTAVCQQLKLLPEVWASELCLQTLNS